MHDRKSNRPALLATHNLHNTLAMDTCVECDGIHLLSNTADGDVVVDVDDDVDDDDDGKVSVSEEEEEDASSVSRGASCSKQLDSVPMEAQRERISDRTLCLSEAFLVLARVSNLRNDTNDMV